jgi:peptidoglycan/LPS O-acetylase OafA/YrhL
MLAVLAFSLYLTNRQVYAWLDNVTGDLAADAPFAAFVLYNAAALAVAALLYVTVERPGLRLRTKLLTARTPVIPKAQSAPDVRVDEAPPVH